MTKLYPDDIPELSIQYEPIYCDNPDELHLYSITGLEQHNYHTEDGYAWVVRE